ncbi:MAG: ABC transporter substrate-binding protein [Desulfobacterales bacterium]|nr:ABC transporter substrate-binding protein [Desulfobacterales bacterium]
MNLKRIVISLFFIIFSANFAYARIYKIGVVPWAGWSPMHVADARGFFKDQGIDVKVVNFPSPQDMYAAFKSKVIDLEFDMLGNIVSFYMEGLPVVFLCETDWSHGGDMIIIKKDFDVANIKSTPIGTYLGQPVVNYFLNKYLSSIGVKFSDVKLVEMEPVALSDKFVSGLFKVIVNFYPNTIRAETEGGGKIVASTATYEGSIPEGMAVLKDVLSGIPKADIEKIFIGWIKSVKWSQDPTNWKDYMNILNNYTFKGEGPYSEEDLKKMLGSVKIHDVKAQILRNQGNCIKFLPP